jgi:hypothetical protein
MIDHAIKVAETPMLKGKTKKDDSGSSDSKI